ncbi:MAG: hypothetical protein ABIO94_13060 [Opitutaceae bacterium]
MKKSFGFIFALALTSALTADEARSGIVVPKPRVRLDPTHHTMIGEPKARETRGGADSVVVMSPYIVRARPAETNDPEEPILTTGTFSPSAGGWIGRKDMGEMRIEVGAWPYRNVMWKVDRFKSDKKHVGTELVRMAW